MKAIRTMLTNLNVAGELLQFFWTHKRWWLIPLVAVLILFAILLVLGSVSGLGPFIYTLF